MEHFLCKAKVGFDSALVCLTAKDALIPSAARAPDKLKSLDTHEVHLRFKKLHDNSGEEIGVGYVFFLFSVAYLIHCLGWIFGHFFC